MNPVDVDLSLQEIGLALDLVSTWQIDTIKSRPLWDSWFYPEESAHTIPGNQGDPLPALDWFVRDLLPGLEIPARAYEGSKFQALTAEIGIYSDRFYIATRARGSIAENHIDLEYLSSPGRGEFEEVACRGGHVNCVGLAVSTLSCPSSTLPTD